MKTDETNIQICVVFSSSKEVKFKVPAHLELIKKVPLEWKMAVIEYTRIATSFPNAKENWKTKSPNSCPFFHCLWPLDHQSWPSGGLWSIWHCGFVSRPKDRDEVSRILARRTSSCVQVSRCPLVWTILCHEVSDFVHTSWDSKFLDIFLSIFHGSRYPDQLRFWDVSFFLVWQKNEVKKITDAFHDLVDGKRILREVKKGVVKGVKGHLASWGSCYLKGEAFAKLQAWQCGDPRKLLRSQVKCDWCTGGFIGMGDHGCGQWEMT